jgi:hypothetical protein
MSIKLFVGLAKGGDVMSQTLLMFEFHNGGMCWGASDPKQCSALDLGLIGSFSQSSLCRASQHHFRGQQVKVLVDDEKAQLHITDSTSTVCVTWGYPTTRALGVTNRAAAPAWGKGAKSLHRLF